MHDPKVVDEALAVVGRTLDRLTERGVQEPAFVIARAQFAARIRASWPANLPGVAQVIDQALANASGALSADEQAELREAADVLRRVPQA